MQFLYTLEVGYRRNGYQSKTISQYIVNWLTVPLRITVHACWHVMVLKPLNRTMQHLITMHTELGVDDCIKFPVC